MSGLPAELSSVLPSGAETHSRDAVCVGFRGTTGGLAAAETSLLTVVGQECEPEGLAGPRRLEGDLSLPLPASGSPWSPQLVAASLQAVTRSPRGFSHVSASSFCLL